MADKGAHKKKTKGRKAAKRKAAVQNKSSSVSEKALTGIKPRKRLEPSKQRNPKAFTNSSSGRAKRQQARSAEKSQRRLHVPQVSLAPEEPPPMVVLVQGPPGVGKTAVIQALIRHYTRHAIPNPKGPITLVAGKQRRITLLECPQDLPGMIDAAKFADLVLLVIDGNFGFEMETFEFLNILQVHGFPKVMGVLTHLDQFRNADTLKRTKKTLKHRFWAEIYQGAKLFYLSGMRNGHYLKREVLNLARFISIMKLRPLAWRTAHPYLLTDRFEDVTPAKEVERHPVCDRTVVLYGYARGRNLTQGQRMHLAGVGDFSVRDMTALPDPCPLPGKQRKKGLNDKERLVYAPMADVGGLLFDKDAVYIDLPDWKISYTQRDGEAREPEGEGAAMVQQLARPRAQGVDAFLAASQIQLFRDGQQLDAADAARGTAGAVQALEAASSSSEGEEDASQRQGSDTEDMASEPSPDTGAGRLRRPALPPQTSQLAPASAAESLSESSQDEAQSSEDGSEDDSPELASFSDEEAPEPEAEGQGQAAKWKQGLVDKAALLFSQQHASLARTIYSQAAAVNSSYAVPAQQAAAVADSDSEGELFVPKSRKRRREDPSFTVLQGGEDLDAEDSVRLAPSAASLAAWAGDAAPDRLRDRFVTGDWEAGAARDAQDPGLAVEESEDDAAGDFEDIETGTRYGADGDEVTRTAMAAIQQEEQEQRRQSKAAKKAAFNEAYDEGGAKAVSTEEGQPAKRQKQDLEEEGDTYYDAMKAEMDERARRTREALDALPEAQRVALEGLRPGTYLRLVVSGVPQELVQHWDPAQPLLAGGLEGGEEARSHLQLRLKRHRWHAKILKSRDPLVFSMGWRRFQSMPVFATEDANGRLRLLKYTPEHMHCMAQIYCPMVPANTGVLAIQSLSSSQQSWRISATGVVVGADASPRVVKKLKLVGEPFRIHKHTAFVHNMFNSPLEVAKFEGASIRTVSGIRGTIKKALRPGVKGGKAGSFRAAFEDKVLLSDLIFLRAWLAVDLPRFYNPVTNLLAPAPARRTRAPQDGSQPAGLSALPEAASGTSGGTHGEAKDGFIAAASFTGPRPGFTFKTGPQGTGYYLDAAGQAAGQVEEIVVPSAALPPAGPQSSGWVGMQTVAQLRRSLGLAAPRNPDSLYKAVARGPRKFHALKIPRKLQAALPFASKPKQQAAAKRRNLDQRRAVVREPGERKVAGLVSQLQALRNQRTQRRRAAQAVRNQKRQKELEKDNEWRQARDKEIRKRRYVLQGQADKHRTKAANASLD